MVLKRMLTGINHKDNINVGFILNLSSGWLGGVNYYKNLLNIIVNHPAQHITPTLFVPMDVDDKLLDGFPDIQVVKTSLFYPRKNINAAIGRLEEKIIGYNYEWEKLLKKHNIHVVSHSEKYFSSVPTISWIPDFQHKYLKNMFSNEEIIRRDKRFEKIVEKAKCILLSSYEAKNDFNRYFPEFSDKVQVLQFVVPISKPITYDVKSLRDKYQLPKQFFYIPNQFWLHKNHRIVIEALSIIKNKDIHVYCTGNTNDYRNKNHFSDLMDFANILGISEQFHVLGMIPYEDVQALTMECKALINPSLFEGWNTMVEEGKSLGKKMILSDLEVHKEQNPKRGVFFNRYDAKSLANAMVQVWLNEENDEKKFLIEAVEDAKKRMREEVVQYRKILEIAVSNK